MQNATEGAVLTCPHCGQVTPDEPFIVSSDCRSVRFGDAVFEFNHRQAAVFKVLYTAWLNGISDVADDTLLEAAGSASPRLRNVFRIRLRPGPKGVERHPAWGTLIVSGTRGSRRLNLPPKRVLDARARQVRVW